MIKTLMNHGSYRVDYFNLDGTATPDALALYVCGELDLTKRYSSTVKNQLYSGLLLVKMHLGLSNLLAVYVDVNDSGSLQRPAYQKLKEDIRAGYFKRIFVYQISDLIGSAVVAEDWDRFNQEISEIELLTYDQKACQMLRHGSQNVHWVNHIHCFVGCVCQ